MDNTSCVSRLVVKALTMHAIDLSEFAVVVVGKPAPYVNSLLRQPTPPYPDLSRENLFRKLKGLGAPICPPI